MTVISLAQKKDRVTSQTTAARFTLGITLSALSGWLFLLAFPPYGLWFLAMQLAILIHKEIIK